MSLSNVSSKTAVRFRPAPQKYRDSLFTELKRKKEQ